ncbi:DEAD/DEAH box helicase [Microbacterium imperiale]|uniref:DNA helicase n=1 Tax=Microbacterium imperiale TaxID=33884 RepID=A0A9W6HF03_9MICO|nr:DEAD/DEAH box helicase [Microbacterium imperiale]MBP2419729.1 superfamily II DNA or RNA helicase [Microbacterium imperiale]MDS0198407.1 DEAD/DEAH box helicase [Microbacterium imperiale]BFE40069.1 DEAD/DEAH box helicase [Microbacterium imperiale]GLJ78956.1 DNA helicase [Microbacterium imperiale]
MTEPRRPSWRSVLAPAAAADGSLALGVQLRQRESAEEAHWGPRRVSPATARSIETSSRDLRLAVRPLVRSATSGRWVQGDETWDSLRRGGWRIDAARTRWFATLYGIAHDARLLGGFGDSEWLTLDGADSDLLWAHLRAAADLGIPIVPTRPDQEVRLGEVASVEVRVESRGGDLELTPVVTVDGGEAASHARPLGHVGVYTVDRVGAGLGVAFAPVALGPGVRALIAAGEPVPIPAADVEDFLSDAYPRLARETSVVAGPGVRLPPPERTVAVVAVEQRPDDVIDYALTWRARGAEPEAWTTERERDPDRLEVRAAVERAWTTATDEPFAPAGRRSGVDAAVFVAQVLPALERVDAVRIEVSGLRRSYRELSGDPRITVRTVETTDADWFELGVHVEIEGRRIPFRPLFTALAQGRKRMLLSDGAYFSLVHRSLDRLRDLIEESRDLVEWETGARVSRYHQQLWSEFEDVADQTEPALRWRRAAESVRTADAAAVASPPAGLVTTLRPYQRDGFAWLCALRDARLGGILADDMGLGKTVQLLAMLLHAREGGETRPALVVAPTSVVAAWRDEAARHAPGLRVRVVETTGHRFDDDDEADVVVTSYALLRLDAAAYAAREWSTVVLDEAQYVKNPRSHVHRAVLALRADVVFAATGTPLENSLTDLWAILSLTSPGLFPSARRFRQEYVLPIEHGRVAENSEGGPARERRLARLRGRIRPFLLRRTKELVATDLPPRQEQDVLVELSSGHRAVYERVLQRERRKVLGLLDDLDSQRFIVFRSLTLLRLLALAPSLVDAGGPGLASSKLEALRDRLGPVVAEGHRALVFSQFTSYLDIVEADLRAHGIGVVRLDGSTTRRAEVIDAFRRGDDPVFLISLKAGGVGLTLTEADYVFLLDPWWNPAAEQQAIDRTHRIGQDRPVTVYRLIAAGTIEEKVIDLQRRKARLSSALLDADGAFSAALSADDIRGLLG